MIFQWGKTTGVGGNGSVGTVQFPISYTTEVCFVISTCIDNADSNYKASSNPSVRGMLGTTCGQGSVTLTDFHHGAANDHNWLAIGN